MCGHSEHHRTVGVAGTARWRGFPGRPRQCEPAEISPGSWLAKEVRLVASFAYLHHEFGLAMRLVADGRLRLDALHTSTVGLAGLDAAFHRLLEGGDEVKVLVDPKLD